MGKWKVGVISASDSIAKGSRVDDRIPIIRQLTTEWLHVDVAVYRTVSDDMEDLKENMIELVDREKCDLLIVTGGTGLSPRDVTPEVTAWVMDRPVPGLAEEMRRAGLQQSRRAMLTRAVAGTRGNTLIINLPGNPTGVEICFNAIGDMLADALNILQGTGEANEDWGGLGW
ncbi:MogA/MoaB family molybdenum cofactor biosynthesis protein [Brevibacillus nitrificans]|uniref:MogA/MoaB family molybdenum cofactor biosynthesis protein n=1 Tax=Brevibacillus nitrificans TaxID=651560 RepID=UPI0026055052|nr:MogA/MoaB family molybdenum cofactor biosynthesis protein [Brevibacillus nitrificans]MED1796793.1 MogA/MoaB family molybdenum cofactor biosynthesis protein [Brevibacillus nitrificans]